MSFPWYGRERMKVRSRARQKRVKCPNVNSIPLPEWRQTPCPAYRWRQDSSAITTWISAFVRTAPVSIHPVVHSVRVQPKVPTACPPPPRATSSIAMSPGQARSYWAAVCAGTCRRRGVLGQRWECFQGSSFVRTSYGDRSHVAGPICRRRVQTAEATPRYPRVSRKGMVQRRNGDEALARESLRRMPELGQRKEDRPRVHGRPETVHGILAPCSLRP